MKQKVSIFWFRRDFRLFDNAGLYEALKGQNPVQPIFIFDQQILKKLPKKDARVAFIHQEIEKVQAQLRERGCSLDVRHGDPFEIWKSIVEEYNIDMVYANKDYEPYARERDKTVYEFLESKGIPFKAKKDHVIFERKEVTKKDGGPYTVYTPYSKVWKAQLTEKDLSYFDSEKIPNWNQVEPKPIPTLEELGFETTDISFPSNEWKTDIIKNYHETRDIPSKVGTSRLSIHLRFGTVSIRELVKKSQDVNTKYLNELIWRDFYQQILWNFPEVKNQNFNRKYDGVAWRNNEEEFHKWCEGKTGYPIVDAGMRELNETGYMHNRVRMITASFLTKHLLIDWRWGEAYFAEKLLDFELASNNGGWQWASGTGVDAAPYFRIFNPYTQTDKFDKDKLYIKKWVPEINTPLYPKPIVDHKLARERALETYKQGISS